MTARHTVALIPQGIPAETLTAISMVGKTVTYRDQQFKLYSVEGYDWYVHQSATTSMVVCDFQMTPSEYRRAPLAFLLPMGCKIGDGSGFEVRFAHVKRGVSLAKAAC